MLQSAVQRASATNTTSQDSLLSCSENGTQANLAVLSKRARGTVPKRQRTLEVQA